MQILLVRVVNPTIPASNKEEHHMTDTMVVSDGYVARISFYGSLVNVVIGTFDEISCSISGDGFDLQMSGFTQIHADSFALPDYGATPCDPLEKTLVASTLIEIEDKLPVEIRSLVLTEADASTMELEEELDGLVKMVARRARVIMAHVKGEINRLETIQRELEPEPVGSEA